MPGCSSSRCRTRCSDLFAQEDHRGDDQRARPARAAASSAARRCGRAMFWVPASGDVGVGVSILSYGGGVQFGAHHRRRSCAPSPQRDHRPLRARVREAAAGWR
ncbi:MAG: WSD1 family O-acyltransferase [Comamonadaceae bacterium]|nr:WSD1 family O-acyltransferase [Comamonadaceae bacterium]